tara:strand:- start:2277 stop:2483 length:207 start_codon:yes stop_codon:yes gene_type:complete
MKVGDLVEYVSSDPFDMQSADCVAGIVTRILQAPNGRQGDDGWANVIWSMPSGPYSDDVPLSSLKVVK